METVGEQTPNLVLAGGGFPIGLVPVEAEKESSLAGLVRFRCCLCSKKPALAAVKYRSKANPANGWAGRGQEPTWLKQE